MCMATCEYGMLLCGISICVCVVYESLCLYVNMLSVIGTYTNVCACVSMPVCLCVCLCVRVFVCAGACVTGGLFSYCCYVLRWGLSVAWTSPGLLG